ncbi:MAG: hypothetical protein IIC50_18140 [Planctomycetes bacterium]|nr:hypothetical protein [Planctomycetota bacterium]
MVLRKCVVGVLSLSLLVAAYFGYLHLVKTPPIETDAIGENEFLSFAEASDGSGGEFGEITHIQVRDPVYVHRDENKRVDRELGFAELYQQGRSRWLVSKPFMNLYPSNRQFICRITADEGAFRVENSRTPYASDVTFTGNVHVHLTPEPNSPWGAVDIFLDDIVFLNDKTQFSTSGAIHVQSERVELRGKGMQFVYDPIQERLQYFHLFELEQLRVKASRDLFSRGTEFTRSLSKMASPPTGGEGSFAASTSGSPVPYECVFHDNVVIRTPKQQVLAYDFIALTDIFWRGLSDDRSDLQAEGSSDAQASGDPSPSRALPHVHAEAGMDIVITCDNGLLLAPRDANWVELDLKPTERAISVERPPLARQAGQAKFEAREIHYSLLSRDGLALGPLELTFYAPEPNDGDPTGSLVPIKVTAQKRAVFLSQENSILFEGDCKCRLLREDPNVVEEFSIDAPQLRIDFVDGVDLRHLEASGGDVTLGIYSRTRTAMTPENSDGNDIDRLLAGVELKCQHFEVDPNSGNEVFIATGPGSIRLNNSKSQGFGQGTDSERRYYAMLEGFDTLWFYVAENRIVADANANSMVFDYFPVVDDGDAYQEIRAQADHIEIQLVTTEEGEREMGNLIAEGNVYFENTERNQQLQASGLSYDHEKLSLVMWSDLQSPCFVDGFAVPGIQMDLKTGEIRFEFLGPGEFPLN